MAAPFLSAEEQRSLRLATELGKHLGIQKPAFAAVYNHYRAQGLDHWQAQAMIAEILMYIQEAREQAF